MERVHPDRTKDPFDEEASFVHHRTYHATMKKNEFIHLHALLLEIRGEFTDSDEGPSDAFREYDARESGPTQIQQNKADHKQAVDNLCLGLTRTLTEENIPTHTTQTTAVEDTPDSANTSASNDTP